MPAQVAPTPVSRGAVEDAVSGDAEEIALAHLKTYLATAEALLAHIDNSHSPIMITSTDLGRDGLRILYANRPYRKMVGYDLDEILGESTNIFAGPETDTDALQEQREELLRTGFTKTELVRYRKGGEGFRSYVSVSRMSDEAPGPGVFLFVEHKVPKAV